MNADAVVERLIAFGLDDREAEAYYHLARLGDATASQLADSSNLKRTDVYRLMDQLVAKGFVEASLERPRRFVPVPIADALAHAVAQRKAALRALDETKDELVAGWPSVPSQHNGSGRYGVHQGRAQISGLLARMVESATEEVVVVALRRGLSRLDHMGLFEALEARAADGLAVRVLTQIDTSNRHVAEALDAFARVRHVDLPGYHQMVIVDNREVALFVAMDSVMSTSDAGETVLWLSSPDFILAQRSLFDLLWAGGLDPGARARELDEGVLADQVTTVRGRWTRTNRVKEMLGRAKHQVLVSIGAAEAARLERSGLARALAHVASEGVEVCVLCDAEPLPTIEGVEVRVGRLAMPGEVFLVDGREGLVALGGEAEPALLTSEQEWAVWTHWAASLEPMVQELASAWQQAAEA